MEIPLLAFDIDGTLVPHTSEPEPRLIRVIESLHSKGCPMVVSTARRRKSALVRLGEMAHFFQDGIFNTGASTWRGGELIQAHLLDSLACRKALEILSGWKGLDFHSLALADEGLAFSRTLNQEELKEWGVEPEDVVSLEGAADLDPIRVCAWREGADLHPLCRRLEEDVREMSWLVTDGGACLFGTAKGIGKGRALADYAGVRGYESKDVMAFGDDVSDIGMFEWAGMGVAMASSPEAAKEAADVVLENDGSGGLVGWLEELSKKLP